ncbi:hypothetical protein CYY_009664 [Polysphondylium violaceum]|uniref:Glycoside hydrolase family 5 domain-containing protein n=1 Tax=Polysphondylium violaceum TaxID=133409 RepID=A0A8J4UPC1_9MYCE|nr:hypothetical protein CYY_009664 [Polysphondylium violaceum]
MKYLNILLLVLLIGLISLSEFVNGVIKVDPTTQFLIDESYRVRLFHGVNVVYKIPPYYPSTGEFDPITSLNQQDIDNLVGWGFNAVRLGVMWPGVEPVEGDYNSTYLDTMKSIVDLLGNSDVYTIVDFHQDLISRKFCGEGIPDWAVSLNASTNFPKPMEKPYPVNTQGYPALDTCLNKEFAEYYFSEEVGQTFQALYSNTNGLRDKFVNYWKQLATLFLDSQTVLGYEIINEPWPGDIYADPKLLIDLGYADKVNLLPLYQIVNQAIREIDNQHCVFFEKALSDVYESFFPAGTPGGVEYNDRQVYSYHIYCGTDRSGNPRHQYVCDSEENIFFNGAMRDLKRIGGGGFMTEFGAVSNSTNSIGMLEFMTSTADKYLQSWTYWAFKYYNDLTTAGSSESLYLPNGQLDVIKVKSLSRTYAQAIAGIPLYMNFDPLSSDFQFKYYINTSISEPTIIYLNQEFYYSNGFTVNITTGDAMYKVVEPNNVYVIPTSTTINNSLIVVNINKN